MVVFPKAFKVGQLTEKGSPRPQVAVGHYTVQRRKRQEIVEGMMVPKKLRSGDQKNEMGWGVPSVDHQLVVEQNAKRSYLCHLLLEDHQRDLQCL